MQSIWKFKLELQDLQKIVLPFDAKILTVQMQAGDMCLWAMIDTDNTDVDPGKIMYQERMIEIIGTGHWIDPHTKRSYIATVQGVGRFVWHVFEVTK